MNENEKRCSKCQQVKELAEFSVNRRSKGGSNSRCRVCTQAVSAAYRLSKHGAAYHKKYRHDHKAEQVFRARAYYADHKTEMAAKSKAYHATHPRAPRDQLKQSAYDKKRSSTLRGRLRTRWRAIHRRCTDPKHLNFKRYGGRGIQCLFTFEEFFVHVQELGFIRVEMLLGLHIHRIDNTDYRIGNIEFLTPAAHGAAHRELRGLEHR